MFRFYSSKYQSPHCYKSVNKSLYSQGDVELLKAMKCEGSSCHGALHFIHARSVSVRLSVRLVPDTLALLPLLSLCVFANAIALSIACLGHHLRTANRNINVSD